MEQDIDDKTVDLPKIQTDQVQTRFLDLSPELMLCINDFLKPLPDASAEQILESLEDILALSQSSKTLLYLLECEIIRHIKKNIAQYKTVTNYKEHNLLSLAIDEKKYKIGSLFLKASIDEQYQDEFNFENIDISCKKMFIAWTISNGHLDVAQICLTYLSQDAISSLLHSAVKDNDENGINFLLKNKADVNFEKDKKTPLSLAAIQGNIKIVRLLARWGANLNYEAESIYYRETPLKLAILHHNKKVVKFLLDNEVPVNSSTTDDLTPIEIALIAANGTTQLDAIIAILFLHGAKECNLEDIFDKERALFFAVQRGYTKSIKLLLDEGIDIDATNKSGWTPLYTAVAYDDIDTVKFLIDAGADVYSQTNTGNTVLIRAILDRNYALCELFSSYNGLINKPAKNLLSPLLHAIMTTDGDFNIIKLLIDAEADISVTDKLGDSVLRLVTISNKLSPQAKYKTIKYLIQKGADVNFVTTADGDSILTSLIASIDNFDFKTYYKLIKFLIKNGAYVNFSRNDDKFTPLMIAVCLNKLEIVHLLIRHGADIFAAEINKKTALDLAKEMKYPQIVRLLTEAKKRGRRS